MDVVVFPYEVVVGSFLGWRICFGYQYCKKIIDLVHKRAAKMIEDA